MGSVYVIAILNALLCAFCFFLSCGRSPTQSVRLEIDPKTVATPLSVSMRFEGLAGNVFKKAILPGENTILLPKDTFLVYTGFLAKEKLNPSSSAETFVYTSITQDVEITKNTLSLEAHYPDFEPLSYGKFGFVLKEQKGRSATKLSNTAVNIQDPSLGTDIFNPSTGEKLGFQTDDQGRASVDIPIFGQTNHIRLVVDRPNRPLLSVTIPVSSKGDFIGFYEIILNNNNTVTLKDMDIAHTYFMDDKKTILEILNSNKNPRFFDTISTQEFSDMLSNELRHVNDTDTVDLLSPIVKKMTNLKPLSLFRRDGREIHIQCKPTQGVRYENCERYTNLGNLRQMFALKSGEKIDFIFLDQDNYPIFNDLESTRERPPVVTVALP